MARLHRFGLGVLLLAASAALAAAAPPSAAVRYLSADQVYLDAGSAAGFAEGDTLKKMIEEDLVAERIAIETYSEIIRWLGDDDPTTRRMIEDILKMEEEHADDLANLLQTLSD